METGPGVEAFHSSSLDFCSGVCTARNGTQTVQKRCKEEVKAQTKN